MQTTVQMELILMTQHLDVDHVHLDVVYAIIKQYVLSVLQFTFFINTNVSQVVLVVLTNNLQLVNFVPLHVTLVLLPQ